MSENATFVRTSVTISPDFLKKCTEQFLHSSIFLPQVLMYAPQYHKTRWFLGIQNSLLESVAKKIYINVGKGMSPKPFRAKPNSKCHQQIIKYNYFMVSKFERKKERKQNKTAKTTTKNNKPFQVVWFLFF